MHGIFTLAPLGMSLYRGTCCVRTKYNILQQIRFFVFNQRRLSVLQKKKEETEENEENRRNSLSLRQILEHFFAHKHLTKIRIQISKVTHLPPACYVRTLHLF